MDPKGRIITDGLPFTSDDYNQAKSVFSAKFARPSEVINTNIQGIMQLSTINGPNP